MNQLTLIDKIQVLFELLFSSPFIIGIFAFSLILMIILFLNTKLNKKVVKLIFVVIYVVIIGFTVIKYGNSFLTSIDSFVTLFMANIYFPTIPIYVLIMLISFIIMIVTLSKKNGSKLVKVINTVFFTLIQMLFAIFIFIVESNKIDVSSNENIYTNEQTLTLLELGMGLFVVWMIILSVIVYLKKADKIFKPRKKEETEDFDDYINDYNTPNNAPKQNLSNTNFNKNVVQNLVPEVDMFSNDEEIISLDDTITFKPINNNQNMNSQTYDGLNSINSQLNNVNSSSKSVFDSFQFLNTSSNNDRKNNDVEVIDFDD